MTADRRTDRRSVDPPRVVDVLPEEPHGRPVVGWLFAWLRQPDGSWEGYVRLHGAATGGEWIPAARLRPRAPLTPAEVRALGGIRSRPDGEPDL